MGTDLFCILHPVDRKNVTKANSGNQFGPTKALPTGFICIGGGDGVNCLKMTADYDYLNNPKNSLFSGKLSPNIEPDSQASK
jgi:hypothetical protein